MGANAKHMPIRKKALLPLAAAALLSGCILPEGQDGQSVWRDDVRIPVSRQIELKVNEATHILHAQNGKLAPGEAGRLGAFLSSQGAPWSMDVLMQPISGEGAAAIDSATAALVQIGVQRTRIVAASTTLSAAGDGDISVTARHVKAVATGCPDWRRSNLIDLGELSSSNFGCATADNLAKMVADPRDLASGRALAPASGSNASAAVERYRTGKVKKLLKRGGSKKGKSK